MGESSEANGASSPEAQPLASGPAAEAVSLALDRARARKGKAGDELVDRFLARQDDLAAEQLHHLQEQFRHLRLKYFGDRMRIGLQILAVVFGVAVAAGLGGLVWQAAGADGLVIKPFSVPPDLAQRGLTGEAAAGELLDRLDAIEGQSRTSVVTKRVSADWGKDVSIAIPQTGMSLDQLDQWLRDKLGHQTRVTGEIVREPDGLLALNVRVGSHSLPVATGPDADLPRMLQQSAEAMYARDLPTNYSIYLNQAGRWDEMLAFGKAWVAREPDPKVKARGWFAIGQAESFLGDGAKAEEALRTSLMLDPATDASAASALGSLEDAAGRWDTGFDYAVQSGTRAINDPLFTRASKDTIALANAGLMASLRHDHLTALAKRRAWVESPAGFTIGTRGPIVDELAALHETGAALREATAEQTASGPWPPAQKASVAQRLQDWPALLVASDEQAAQLAKRPDGGRDIHIWQWRKAEALARLERLAEAQQVIAPTPLDCAPCVMSRGLIAAFAGQAALSDHWYSEASRISPRQADAPFAWGEALARRGQRAQAIAQFGEADRRAPRWADPLKAWGEVLLAEGDAAGAAGKFQEAADRAPRWGRLRVKWGEALMRLGKRDEARAQFKAAAGMDLTDAERAELAQSLRV
jgi:tetratricopeptide (TPR) repeat protein